MIFLSSVEVIDRRSVERAGDNFFVASCPVARRDNRSQNFMRGSVERPQSEQLFSSAVSPAFLFSGESEPIRSAEVPFSRLDSLDRASCSANAASWYHRPVIQGIRTAALVRRGHRNLQLRVNILLPASFSASSGCGFPSRTPRVHGQHVVQALGGFPRGPGRAV